MQLAPAEVRGRELWLDGYNVLTLLESALSGGVVLLGRDGCCRDIAGIHRRYRKVNETAPVLQLVGETTAGWGVTCCRWWLDQPVSNSGRLKTFIGEAAAAAGWNMPVELAFNPDQNLWESESGHRHVRRRGARPLPAMGEPGAGDHHRKDSANAAGGFVAAL